MESIGDKATEIYSEHKTIVARKHELAGKAFGKALSRSGQLRNRVVEAMEAKSGPLREGEKNKILFGRRLGSNINRAMADYKTNVETASAHYTLHANEYHQMAMDEAQSRDAQINFDGDVAATANKQPSHEQLREGFIQ